MRRQTDFRLTTDTSFRVLIVCDHASAKFGGEAILPLHYFRLLRNRGIEVWLVAHARTRPELIELFPGERRILYVEETLRHTLLWSLGKWLPPSFAYATTGFLLRLDVQMAQRKIARRLVAREGIDLVHQPTPVSPREPSIIHDVGAPVIIGPMNGGMDYPPAFRAERPWFKDFLFRFGVSQTGWLNKVMPGKRRAAILLVANERTRAALPTGVCGRVEVLVENGVELDLWNPQPQPSSQQNGGAVTFGFVGRLIKLKAVDLLLDAFAIASVSAPMRLVVIGEGEERERLEQHAAALFPTLVAEGPNRPIRFVGWVSQSACASELAEVDCLVMPSLRDCGGAVILEAMAMSKPVIATAWGGALDYLDRSCGILVEPSSRVALVEGIAAAMVRLADSPGERAAMGRAARLKVESDYDWEVKADDILRVYRRVLGAATVSASAAAIAT
jgi:glycosyltransferase involved in cell wall biosynthesis